MRYEAKHHYFKRLSVTLGNYINLPYSLSKRHQEGLCYKLKEPCNSSSSFMEKGIEIGPGFISVSTHYAMCRNYKHAFHFVNKLKYLEAETSKRKTV